MKNRLSAKQMTSTSVVTIMVRNENDPKNSVTKPIVHITARNGVAATRIAAQNERSATSEISAPSPKP